MAHGFLLMLGGDPVLGRTLFNATPYYIEQRQAGASPDQLKNPAHYYKVTERHQLPGQDHVTLTFVGHKLPASTTP
jgi:hypothetical protein